MNRILFLCGMFSFAAANGQQRNPALDTLLKLTDSTVLKAKIAELKKGGENDLQSLATFYNYRRKWDEAQAVYELAAGRFPKSELAFHAASGNIRKEPDAGRRRQVFVGMKENFAAYAAGVDFQMMTTTLAQKSLDEGRLDEALFYLESIQLAPMYASIARGVFATDTAKGLALAKAYINTKPKPVGAEMLAAYTHMLIGSGNLKQASPYAKEAYQKSKRNEEFISDYTKSLQSEEAYGALANVLENALMDGHGSATVTKDLLGAYQKLGMDGKAAFAALMERYRQKLKADLAKKMISKPSPAFALKDEKGRTVSLSDFKGKTIVLDFWATWCIPCKKSFPAMQAAVDKYKGDNSVQFLFIHTWDKGTKDPLKDAAAYLKEKRFTFDLYMDYKDLQTEKHPAVTSFNVTGIPTKFVIDGNGNIRFKVDGFYGADEAATEEVITMIEMAKAGSGLNAKK